MKYAIGKASTMSSSVTAPPIQMVVQAIRR